MESLQIKLIKQLFFILGKEDKKTLLESSNLTDRESDILVTRFIRGLSAKESAELLNLDIDTYNKQYHRCMTKFYNWLNRLAELHGFDLIKLMEK